MYDLFYDEDSTCPECDSKLQREWQTRRLESLFERWKRGDFLQYREWEPIPERERRKKYGASGLAPAFRLTGKFRRKTPLLQAGKVPVSILCDRCKSWLVAYAKITGGKFIGIVEAEVGEKDKEFIRFGPKTTAKTLRDDFARRLEHFQESCKHETTKWISLDSWTNSYPKEKVCVRCEKILETILSEDKRKRGRRRKS